MTLPVSKNLSTKDCQTTGANSFLGLHLSGSNSPRTAAVILSGGQAQRAPTIEGVYEKIGSFGSIFSDERLLTIIAHKNLSREIFVDVPLSLPPCGLCERPTCPGVVECHDLAVAYMLKLSQFNRTPEKKRRKRPLNPQSQRLWDMAHLDDARFKQVEPSYNSGKSSLYIRIKALKKRIQALGRQHELLETSIPHSLAVFAADFGFSQESCMNYRNFEEGRAHRKNIFAGLVSRSWIEPPTIDLEEKITSSLDIFHALVCAVLNTLHSHNQLSKPPDEVYASQGWVYLPQVDPSL